jgi:ketosteroid isomerase-like protein
MTDEMELIERAYRAYFTVFQMGNPRAITPYYHVPSVFISGTGTHVLASLQDAESFFERLFFTLRQRGYSRSVLSSVQVKCLSDDLALVHSRGERLQRDGQLLERLAALYTMRKSEGTWRIATAMMFDPERPLHLT